MPRLGAAGPDSYHGLVERVLVVDAANVVGAVPDGWWRDRAGAAARLHAGLVAGLAEGRLPYDRVILVLEGRARDGVAIGEVSGVLTVHAPGPGDDEIAAQCRAAMDTGAAVTLASADSGLIDRVVSYPVAVVGPRTVRLTSR